MAAVGTCQLITIGLKAGTGRESEFILKKNLL